jgi:N-acetylmuramoyl-L-alanine amidase
MCLLCAAGVSLWLRTAIPGFAAGEEKRLTVYYSGGSFTLPVSTVDKQDYVGAYELFEPMATTVLKLDGRKAKLQVNGAELEFTDGSNRLFIKKKRYDLSSKALVQSGRPMLALGDITGLLARALGESVNFHETGRRLFIGNTGSQFSATLKPASSNGAEGAALVLSFPSAVSPRIFAEGNQLRMVFQNEPILAGSENVRYNDPLISALSYAENNGAAEIVVSGTAPLLASFSGGGQIISISAAPAPPPVVAEKSTSASPNPGQPAGTASPSPQPGPQATAPSASATPTSPVRVQVVIDPAHGGDDSGERFTDTLLEKDLNLAVARRLRSALAQQGIVSLLLRDGDRDLSADDRSLATNVQKPLLYVAIHTSGLGSGIRINSDLASSPAERQSRFIPWNMAQSLYSGRSRSLAAALAAGLNKQNLNAAAGAVPVVPLDRMACPALALEIAPPPDDAQISQLSSVSYQESLAEALAKAIASSLGRSEAQ